jgi:hypothetical protein
MQKPLSKIANLVLKPLLKSPLPFWPAAAFSSPLFPH